MLLVFFFIIIFIGILFFILNVKFSVKKLVISNINSQRKIEWDFKINIGLYIGKKVKIFNLNFDKSFLVKNKIIKKMNRNVDKIKRKNFLKKLRKLNCCCEFLDLNVNLGTDSCIVTSYIVPVIATVIETIIMKINSYNYNPNTNYVIRPIYNNGNIIDINLRGSVYINVKNFLKVIVI